MYEDVSVTLVLCEWCAVCELTLSCSGMQVRLGPPAVLNRLVEYQTTAFLFGDPLRE